MGTNCAPLIADSYLYCYKSHFMAKLKITVNNHEFTNVTLLFTLENLLKGSGQRSCPFLDLIVSASPLR